MNTKIKPTTLGVQSFSAGLLFATAVKAAGDNLTRSSVLSQLKKIHSWDGGGLQMKTDPGANAVTTCFLYMEVKGGKFELFHPTKVNSFDCSPSYATNLHDDFGGGGEAQGRVRQAAMTDVANILILGLVSASIYAVAASGLVVTYTTSGIFNFAHGAIAMFSAFMYWQLRSPDAWGLPAPLAARAHVVRLRTPARDRHRPPHHAAPARRVDHHEDRGDDRPARGFDPARHGDLAPRHRAGEPAAVLPGPQGQDRRHPGAVPLPRGLRDGDRGGRQPPAPAVPDEDRRGHARRRRQPRARRTQRGQPRPGVGAQLGPRIACWRRWPVC